MRNIILTLLTLKFVNCELWPKGVVHYKFNHNDYDPHSQERIMEVFSLIEKEICVKFFYTKTSLEENNKILFISNPEHKKGCPAEKYNYNDTVVNMTIGYRCINNRDLPKMIVAMLRASIAKTDTPQPEETSRQKHYTRNGVISIEDRNFINDNYDKECYKLDVPLSANALRRQNVKEGELTDQNIEYYSHVIWPMGVVNFEFNYEDPVLEANVKMIESAMSAIEANSCIQFHDTPDGKKVDNYVSFEDDTGEEIPLLGIQKGKQVINIKNMTEGTPGHKSHVLLNLLRILGLPLESNRADRNNYVKIKWDNVEMGKEQYFEMDHPNALLYLNYDFDSVLHAPVNWLCTDECRKGGQTIKPIGDHDWSRTMTIGRSTTLSGTDKKKIHLVYGHECKKREIKLSLTKE